jgi:hypothetical protein
MEHERGKSAFDYHSEEFFFCHIIPRDGDKMS